MSDIVEQLRSYGDDERQHFREARATLGSLLRDAADEITRLRAENERLRAALERLSCKCPSNCDWEKHGDICPSWVARTALTQETRDE